MKQIHIIFAILFAINCNTITKVQLDSNNNNNYSIELYVQYYMEYSNDIQK